MKKYVCLSLVVNLVLCLLLTLPSLVRAEREISLKVQSYSWREYHEGSKLLEESGALFGADLLYRFDFSKSFVMDFNIELFGGSVGYDGHTQAGDSVQTDTNYLGVDFDIDFYRKFSLIKNERIVCSSGCSVREAYLAPFVGIGLKKWNRQIESAETDNLLGIAIGYTEHWFTIYTRFGVKGEYGLSLSKVKGFAEAGMTLPLYTSNTFDGSVFGLSEDITVNPKSDIAFFARAGVRWGRLELSGFYEGIRFSESDLDDTYHAFFQPESRADMFGLSVGFYF